MRASKVVAPLTMIWAIAHSGLAEETSLEDRVEALEKRILALENRFEAPKTEEPISDQSSIVEARLVRKEAQHHMGNSYNLVFDVEFKGTDTLGNRRIRDIKGTLWFQDAFGENIAGARTTERLNIRAGETKVSKNNMVDWKTFITNEKWRRVLTTDKDELRTFFEVESVIYDDSLSLAPADYRAIQTILHEKGFSIGVVDGKWGPASERAIRAFQKQAGIAITGSPDRATLDALGFGK